MKILILCGLGLVVLGGIVTGMGYLLPVTHRASRTEHLDAPTSAVWDLISDFKNAPSWRKELQSVEAIPNQQGKHIWREVSRGNEAVDYETVTAIPQEKLVRRIASKELPYAGSWTFELSSDGSRTRLTITEDGEVYNPIFRFVSKFILGHEATISRYFKSLKQELGRRV